MDCSICCDTFNKSSRKPVVCNRCDVQACMSCVKRYMLGNTQDPHCMSCKGAWNYAFLETNITKVFLHNEYKKHRENVLLEREKSLLPATQVYAEQEVHRREVVQAIKDMITERNGLKKNKNNHERIRELNNLIYDMREHIRNLGANRGSNETTAPPPPSHVRGCPNDECRGFISKDNWSCSLCNTKICEQCHETVTGYGEDVHECTELGDADDATVVHGTELRGGRVDDRENARLCLFHL